MARRPNQPTLAQSFDDLRTDYDAAKESRYRRRRTGVITLGSTADWHSRVEANFLGITEQARDMDRNDPIVGQMVTRAMHNTIQDGFICDPQTGDPGVDAALYDRWQEWAGDPDQVDIAGELSFPELEKLILRQMLVDGDIVALPQREGCLQLMESHRLRTPKSTKKNVVNGVLLGDDRKRLQYWFTKDDISPYVALNLVSDTTPLDVRDADGFRQIFHVYNPTRATQTRGISALVPIFDPVGQFTDITFSKLVQQQLLSVFGLIRTRELGDEGLSDQTTGQTTIETLPDGTAQTIQGIAPGMQIRGLPGEKIEAFSSNVPNAEFFPHMKLTLTLIGINLGMPLVLLLLDASETNFSGFRGALDQARLGFRANQRHLIGKFHKPVYEWKVRQWLADDPALRSAAARAGIKILKHVWNPPTWPYIEPLKDASADLLRVRNCLISPRRLHNERGRDWEQIATETVEDNSLAIRKAKLAAQAINSEIDDGKPVHWRELLSLPMADGITLQIAPESGSEAPDKQDAGDKPADKKPKSAGGR